MELRTSRPLVDLVSSVTLLRRWARPVPGVPGLGPPHLGLRDRKVSTGPSEGGVGTGGRPSRGVGVVSRSEAHSLGVPGACPTRETCVR